MMLFVWVILLAAFIIIEACTAQLLTVWFAVGSFCALVATFFTDSVLIQVAVFAVVSVIVLAATRPLVKKITKATKQPTNADMYIGKDGIVTEEIDNFSANGTVKVKGSVWSARSENEGLKIAEGSLVKVIRIEGVKLIVTPVQENNN